MQQIISGKNDKMTEQLRELNSLKLAYDQVSFLRYLIKEYLTKDSNIDQLINDEKFGEKEQIKLEKIFMERTRNLKTEDKAIQADNILS